MIHKMIKAAIPPTTMYVKLLMDDQMNWLRSISETLLCMDPIVKTSNAKKKHIAQITRILIVLMALFLINRLISIYMRRTI